MGSIKRIIQTFFPVSDARAMKYASGYPNRKQQKVAMTDISIDSMKISP